MFVEVHYDVPPVFILPGDTQSNDGNASGSRILQVGQGVSLEIPAEKPTPFVPPPNIVSVEVASDTVRVTVQYVGDFYSNPIYMYVYPHGTTAERNGEDSAYTFAGNPTEGPSIGGITGKRISRIFAVSFRGRSVRINIHIDRVAIEIADILHGDAHRIARYLNRNDIWRRNKWSWFFSRYFERYPLTHLKDT